MTDRCIAALIFAIGYFAILTWLYVRIRNGNTRKDAGDEGADWGREGSFGTHFDSASNSTGTQDHV